jgi:hypothetical protein
MDELLDEGAGAARVADHADEGCLHRFAAQVEASFPEHGSRADGPRPAPEGMVVQAIFLRMIIIARRQRSS